ncbi:MAG: prepilin-type N-terminal cleavage/methylation domain-containing protein [Planctomycetes bacterium]|nr:prepilin-type N-terminal cleavage/methylation domain-containing protein [Planctomycetota bacterium]
MARRRAFTLLEVLMVIVILGVLASLIAPRLMGSGKVPGQYNADGVDLWSFGPDKSDGTEDDIKNWKQS